MSHLFAAIIKFSNESLDLAISDFPMRTHLEERFSRLQATEIPEFNASLSNPSDVERFNEIAFEASVITILNSLISLAKSDAESVRD